MTMTLLFPILLAIIGALLYALANGKASELGRLTFMAGVIAIALLLSGYRVHIP